ncbi:MAG TPA: terminase family protein [Fimbriiglobus sp.]|nr:terminase family protein [Fimbriiglobus sp.]
MAGRSRKKPAPGDVEDALAAVLGQAGRVPAGDDGPAFNYLAERYAQESRAAAAELARRKFEALSLYEALPVQEAFHQSRARQRLLRGSNRSGKTLSAAVELARAVMGKDPYRKYPLEDGRAYVVGLDLMHVSQVFYRKLFRAGAFKMIRDAVTGKWRAYRPWQPEDAARQPEAKLAPPLIPPRLVETIAWEEKGKSIPKMVKLTSGWEITFFSSQAKPPQGMDLDLVWFDEELEDEEWYPEMAARLLDRRGVFFWSATPQAGNEQLLSLSERAERDARLDPFERVVEEFLVLLDDNPHIEDSEKKALASLYDDEQAEVRVGGEFAARRWRVFPEFQPATHVRSVPDVPLTWTRYAAIDPGRQVCAVLFGAVPPPGQEPFDLLLYDELYIRDCSADILAERMSEKVAGQDFELFVIDWQMGRQTQLGSGETVEFAYAKAFKKHRVRSRKSGHGFAWADSNVKGGVELVRSWLRAEPNTGCPRVVVREGTCPSLRTEIKHYRYKRARAGGKMLVTDEPETRGAVHQMANLRYLIGCRPKYVRPEARAVESDVLKRFREKETKRRLRAAEDYRTLGPRR